MEINRDAMNRLHALSTEQFTVTFRCIRGRERTYGPDSFTGILGYLMPTDTILALEKV